MEEENKELLKEQLKRFNTILEYTFMMGMEGDVPNGDKDKLLFGGESDLYDNRGNLAGGNIHFY